MASPDRLNPFRNCKRDRKARRGSQTDGKTKNIHATAMCRTMCRRNRSYKMIQYREWIKAVLMNDGRELSHR